eukprot:gene5173-3720_t
MEAHLLLSRCEESKALGFLRTHEGSPSPSRQSSCLIAKCCAFTPICREGAPAGLFAERYTRTSQSGRIDLLVRGRPFLLGRSYLTLRSSAKNRMSIAQALWSVLAP